MPLIVDNTVATPYLIRPFEWGADIVVHSATKYLGGHGTAIAGVIVDGGRFDWAAHADKFPGLTTPDPSYHGVVYTEAVGNLAYIIKARVQLLRDLGPAIAPFNAFLIAQGLETLSLRIERHVANAPEVAEWLEQRDEVERTIYAGLPSSPWYELGQKYSPQGAGAIVSFEIKGGLEAGQAVRRTHWSCTATWPTSATSARWSSTRRRRRTRSCLRRSSWRPASRPAWSGSRSASRGSTTFSPTSTSGSVPPRRREPGARRR